MRQKNQSCTFSAIDWSLSIADRWPTFFVDTKRETLDHHNKECKKVMDMMTVFSPLYQWILTHFCLYFSRWNVRQPRWKELLQSVLCQLIIKLLVYLTGVFLHSLNDLPVSRHCINLTNSFLCKKVCSTVFSCWLLSVFHPRWDLSLYSIRYSPFLYLHLLYHWSKRFEVWRWNGEKVDHLFLHPAMCPLSLMIEVEGTCLCNLKQA
jgi:hypothetical protein